MSNSQESQPMRTVMPNDEMAAAIAQQTAMLRTVLERMDEVIELLTPKPSEGPTLDELIGGLVTLVSDQTVLLKRIDARTAVLVEPHLRSVTTPNGRDTGANGDGVRG